MPLSKCRYCGKKVPNPYRPYHEKVLCLVRRKREGKLLWRELPKVEKPVEPIEHPHQKRLFEVCKPRIKSLIEACGVQT